MFKQTESVHQLFCLLHNFLKYLSCTTKKDFDVINKVYLLISRQFKLLSKVESEMVCKSIMVYDDLTIFSLYSVKLSEKQKLVLLKMVFRFLARTEGFFYTESLLKSFYDSCQEDTGMTPWDLEDLFNEITRISPVKKGMLGLSKDPSVG